MMKKYIAPACEMVNLAPSVMLALSFEVDSDKTTDVQLSNRHLEIDDIWDEQ